MNSNSILLIGGPDSGKTNFVGRLWIALDSKKHRLFSEKTPNNIVYVEDAVKHLMHGKFAPRSNTNYEIGREDCVFHIKDADNLDAGFEVIVPDISGELWKSAVVTHEISSEWMTQMKEATGALVFVRPRSDQIVDPLDWVTAGKFLQLHPEEEHEAAEMELPTQVMLCELLRFLEYTLQPSEDGNLPKVAIVVAAWDLLDAREQALGPVKFLKDQFPLFAGMVKNHQKLDINVFALSVAGGDFEDAAFRAKYLEAGDLSSAGWCVHRVGSEYQQEPDVTLPVAWALGY